MAGGNIATVSLHKNFHFFNIKYTIQQEDASLPVFIFAIKEEMKMKTITDYFKVRGSGPKYPGRAAVVEALHRGEKVKLQFDRDVKDQLIVVNPETREAVGCIPPIVCKSDCEIEEKYDLLECFVDLGFAMPIAVKSLRQANSILLEVNVVIPETVAI